MKASCSIEMTDQQSDIVQASLPLENREVLLAEDCIDQGRLYLHYLQKAGASVTLECNGLSAVGAVKKSLTRYDAIVMDFQMPEIDGLQATKQLRELGYRGAIIAVTAYGTRALEQSWLLAGCDEFIEKPLGKTQLIIAVTQCIAKVQETSQA